MASTVPRRFALVGPSLWILFLPATLIAQDRPRARDLGVPVEGRAGPLDAITDVAGVEVGHATIVSGRGPVRTGVTAVFPRGRMGSDTVFAGWYALNGNGEMTGTTWVRESGILEGPVLITNTHSVGVVRDAVIEWMEGHRSGFLWALPVVAETYDGDLNDINGFHVTKHQAFEALNGAGGVPRGPWIDHHRRGDRCPAAPAPARSGGQARRSGRGEKVECSVPRAACSG